MTNRSHFLRHFTALSTLIFLPLQPPSTYIYTVILKMPRAEAGSNKAISNKLKAVRTTRPGANYILTHPRKASADYAGTARHVRDR